MRRLIFLAAGVLVPALLMAQLEPVWVNVYNGPYGNHREAAEDMVVDEDGYVYVCGDGMGPLGTTTDYITIKYDPTTGETLWVRYYDGLAHSHDDARAIAVDNAGGVYVTGISYLWGSSYDYATVKYNSSGVQQWVARYNGPSNGDDVATAIAVDNSGGVYVTGCSYGAYNDYATVKYNSSGVQQWVARYNGPSNGEDYAYAIAVDNSGGVYVTGNSATWVSYRFFYDYATVKYNASDGGQCWVAYYDGQASYDDYPHAIAVDNLGGVYVTGQSWAWGIWYDYATVKYNAADGSLGWPSLSGGAARYNGPANGYDNASAIAVDNSGGVYVTGWSASHYIPSQPNYAYATLKYDAADGTEAWLARYNGPAGDNDVAYAMALDESGVYVTGYSCGVGSLSDFTTVMYDRATGTQLDCERYTGPGLYNDVALSIACNGAGAVFVTGYSDVPGEDFNIVTIKYGPPVIEAAIDVDPNKLNLKSKGKWVTGYIELPEGFAVEDIVTSTVAISAVDGDLLDPPLYRDGPTEVGDYDHDDISDLMVKFDRQELVDILRDMGYGDGDRPELTVTGGLAGDTTFKGVDTIELIDKKGGGQGEAADLPKRPGMQPSSPNPFKLTTTIRYGLPAETRVRLEVYSPTGQRVATLVDRFEGAGYHSASWDGRDDRGRELVAGVYFCRFEAGTYKTTRKTQLLR
jgi:hypothetical protein